MIGTYVGIDEIGNALRNVVLYSNCIGWSRLMKDCQIKMYYVVRIARRNLKLFCLLIKMGVRILVWGSNLEGPLNPQPVCDMGSSALTKVGLMRLGQI